MDTRAVRGGFETTRWTRVRQAAGRGQDAEQALGELCTQYWFPLYAYARRWGRGRHDAEDAVQGFFFSALHRGLFQAANPNQGRLRSFLLTAFKRHLQDAHAHEHAAKRRPEGGWEALDLEDAESRFASEAQAQRAPEAAFDRQWALQILTRARETLAARYQDGDSATLFKALEPYLTGAETDVPLKELAEQLGMKEGALRVALHRMRHRFRDCLRATIRDTVSSDDEVDDELENLRQVLLATPR